MHQLICLIEFTITGIVIGILFDIFRILRKSFKTADWITTIQDILFLMIAGAIILFSIFKFNNGEIRIYIFIGIALGILIYMLTFSKYIIKFSVIIMKFISKISSYPIKLILNVVVFIIKPLKFLIKKIKSFFKNILQKATKNTKKNSKIKTKFVKKEGIL